MFFKTKNNLQFWKLILGWYYFHIVLLVSTINFENFVNTLYFQF